MKQINEKQFQEEVLDFKGVVLVDFFAEWCGPCKMLSPMLEDLDYNNKDEGIKFVKIDVDESQELAGKYGIMSIPTVMVFKDGKFAGQQVGVADKEHYLGMVEEAKKAAPVDASASDVTVFTTQTCPYCTMVKNYLKEKSVTYKEVDVSRDEAKAMEMISKSGQIGVPQLWIGSQVIVGFDRPKIDMLLGF